MKAFPKASAPVRCWVPTVEHARTGGQEVHSPPHPFGNTRLTCPFSSQNSLQRAVPAGLASFLFIALTQAPPQRKEGGKAWEKWGIQGRKMYVKAGKSMNSAKFPKLI